MLAPHRSHLMMVSHWFRGFSRRERIPLDQLARLIPFSLFKNCHRPTTFLGHLYPKWDALFALWNKVSPILFGGYREKLCIELIRRKNSLSFHITRYLC